MTHSDYQYFQGLFEGCDKTILSYQSWRPIFCEKVVVIVHGLGEHSGRYRPLIDACANRGIGFYAYDQRGHGRSKGVRGHAPTFNHLADDLGKFLKLISVHESHPLDGRKGSLPIFVFGHSLGGLVCLKYLSNLHRKGGVIPKGVMLSNPILGLALPIPGWKVVMAKFLANMIPQIRFHNEVNLEELSHDPKVGEVYKKDPLAHQKISAGLYYQMLQSMEYVKEEAGMMSVPILLLLGSADKIIDPKASEEFYSNINCDPKKMIIYPNFRHELIQEVGKEKIFSDILDWMGQFESGLQEVKSGGSL